ncbi:response regulator [Daejeonella sp.]|uniref:response regulator n=1 Tax=Daejeonella sp. TaxID=2805397 RepID=UPI00272FB3A2|nr:response regulator [Daejeonella sp.]MDP2415305.1 response regulator [Daejeonella sp.]
MRKFSFQTVVITGFIVTLACVFIVALSSYLSIKKLQSSLAWVVHSEEVIVKTREIEYQLTSAETGQRGYLVTGETSYLERYRINADNIPILISDLQVLVSDNPEQLSRADSLGFHSMARLQELQNVLNVLQQSTFEAAREEVLTNRGKMHMDNAHRVISDMRREEMRLLAVRKANSDRDVDNAIAVIVLGCLLILLMVLVLLGFIRRTFSKQKRIEASILETNKELNKVSAENKRQNWLLEGAVVVDEAMRGTQTLAECAQSIISELAKYVKADLGAIYIAEKEGNMVTLAGMFAFQPQHAVTTFRLGEGMVGQAALEKKGIILTNIPSDYIKVTSALGNASLAGVLIYPLILQGQLKGVIELGFLSGIAPNAMEFLDKVSNSIAMGINAVQSSVEMQNLYERSQAQAEELESQQEELRTANEELLNKTEALQASEEELRVQQEELRQINVELEEQAEQLEERNKLINEAREAISVKAQELEQTGKYKSEFLANMSHELRTPLNSILILARILGDNKHANLNEEQLKYARVIHNAGSDLLTLINDILDLSKVESGKMDLTIEDVYIDDIKRDLELLFDEVAGNKKVNFSVQVEKGVPASIVSDRVRVEQILRNLLSNAFKFTPENGSVTVKVKSGDEGHAFTSSVLKTLDSKDIISMAVTDTGIGIPEEKQQLIFEAFQQADGSTSRKYGGTGLGLSISRELAVVLGGEISVSSAKGGGSIFTLFLPRVLQAKDEEAVEEFKIPDERAPIEPFPVLEKASAPGESVVLIIEDDTNFAEILKDYAIQRGFKPILAYSGDTGLELAKKLRPQAIILDIMLPVMDGWTVLKHLKSDPGTKDIPVHMMSAGDEKKNKAERGGALGFLKKPVTKEKLDEVFDNLVKNRDLKLAKVLIVEDHEIQSEDIKRKFVEHNIQVVQAFTGNEARKILNDEHDFDCLILDVNLPDISGLDLLDEIRSNKDLKDIPVVINTAMELDKNSLARVMEHTDAMVLKNSKSNERLLDEVNLFMNKVKSTVPAYSSPLPSTGNSSTLEKVLKDKTILIVDDDMRNIFALSSALQAYDLSIEVAHNGREALNKLDSKPDINLVLMDIMMPEMDGYEAMTEIRKQSRFKNLPIIALTAKAMKNDRDKCISSGANDYASKPVDVDKLLSLIRVWLS